ncbi:Uncharacterised protein [Helicobacter mustelae]|nr:Uncharacterised protein [Helicobacter mustelae]STP12565.1 Uncharacterised protein [Helicobacter mustelae]
MSIFKISDVFTFEICGAISPTKREGIKKSLKYISHPDIATDSYVFVKHTSLRS